MSTVEESAINESDVATVTEEMIFPVPPEFDNVADERAHRKQSLVDALHILGALGFAEGAAGHIRSATPNTRIGSG